MEIKYIIKNIFALFLMTNISHISAYLINANSKFISNVKIISNIKLNSIVKCRTPNQRFYPLSKMYHDSYLNRTNYNANANNFFSKTDNVRNSNYHFSRQYYENYIKRLNTKNITLQNERMLNDDFMRGYYDNQDDTRNNSHRNAKDDDDDDEEEEDDDKRKGKTFLVAEINGIKLEFEYHNPGPPQNADDNPNGEFEENHETGRRNYVERENSKSKNFEVVKKGNTMFKDIGGYENVKQELMQCVDILTNYQKYAKYNVRVPKGLILEGPPGTGKTLLAKALAGESGCGFISVSGSDFQEKYVGVGSSRIKELFKLAKKNIPCIIFVDEIDALGRKRSSDGESSSNERDNTLNALLVELDGFKNNSGIFVVAATNRIDLLDSALVRPGRIDKKIYIGVPNNVTREAIINIHIKGKPYSNTINVKNLVEITEGLTGAQIENLLNEAMLNALRYNETAFSYKDFDLVLNKMMVGWQPTDHEFTGDIIDHIVIHEMGHAIVGILSKFHSKMTKVVINLSSPRSPGYTVFEGSTSNIYVREALFEHLMILLSGRIAEEVFYGVSVTTGAINDFEEALKLAEKMIIYYGMGKNVIYPSSSEKYKEIIDTEVIELINYANKCAEIIIMQCKDLIKETSEMLKQDKILQANVINELISSKYSHVLDLKIDF